MNIILNIFSVIIYEVLTVLCTYTVEVRINTIKPYLILTLRVRCVLIPVSSPP